MQKYADKHKLSAYFSYELQEMYSFENKIGGASE